NAEEGTATVILPIRLLVNGLEGSLDHEGSELSRRAFGNLVLEPGKDGMRERLTGLEHDVTEKAVAEHHLTGIFKKIAALDIATEIERALTQELKHLF